QARDGEHGLAVELGVVEAVEQVDAAGARGGEADAEPAGPLRIGAGVECGSFLVADLDEANLVLVGAQRLDDAVDAVTWNAEHRVDAPVDQGFDEHVAGGRFGHSSLLVDLRESRPRKKSPAALLTGRAAPQFRFGRMTVTATSRTGRVREWNFLIRRTISPAAGESS